MYVTYDYYTTTYGGNTIPSSDFNNFEREARRKLDEFTFNRIKKDNTLIDDDVKECLCVMMEKQYSVENQLENNIASETVDRVTTTYVTNADMNTTLSNKLYSVAKSYLWETGLLYRGLD